MSASASVVLMLAVGGRKSGKETDQIGKEDEAGDQGKE